MRALLLQKKKNLRLMRKLGAGQCRRNGWQGRGDAFRGVSESLLCRARSIS